MNELNLITDMVEEQIAKGNLQWLAHFNEVRRNIQIEDLKIPLYATGGLEEKGFLLSRLFSALVTPKYKVQFLLYTISELDEKFLRKLITACKRKFGEDDWIFLGLVQEKPIGKTVKNLIENLVDTRVGIVAYSLASKDEISSNNVLGKGLKKQLKLTEPKFEAFDVPDYMKGFTLAFLFSTLALLTVQLVFKIPAFNLATLPLTVLILVTFSVVAGYSIYKSRYHTSLVMTTRGFELRKGRSSVKHEWNDFKDLTIYISPQHETFIRLYGEKEKVDIPLSRVGLPRKDAYEIIRGILKGKQ